MKTLILLCLLSLPAFVLAQQNPTPKVWTDSTKNVLIELKDGTSLKGRIISYSVEEVLLRTQALGLVKLQGNNIEGIKEIEGFYQKGRFWVKNPHTTRYFFAPSAYNLKKGEAYYQNAYLFANSVNYGINDNFSMGIGTIFNPSFKDWQMLFFTPKFSFQASQKVRFGGGAMIFTEFRRKYSFGFSQNRTKEGIGVNSFGIFYGNTTVGSAEHNATLGLGWGVGYDFGEIASIPPIINLNGMTRVGKNVSLISENWFVVGGDNSGGITSAGVRIFGERMSVDIAGLVPVGTGSFLMIPYVDFVYKFGKR